MSYSREYYQNHPEEFRVYRRRNRLKRGEEQNKRRRERRRTCPEMRQKEADYQKIYAKTHQIAVMNRKELIRILGGRCSNIKCLVPERCVDIRCLQLDHINGGGVKDVKRFKNSGSMYKYYLEHIDEAMKKLQVLCANCNWIKRAEKNENKVSDIRTIKRITAIGAAQLTCLPN